MRVFFGFFAVLLALVSSETAVHAADAAVGTIVVTVTDSRRGPVSQAPARLTGAAFSSERATNDVGVASFNVSPGVYQVVVSKAGFQTASSDDVPVVSGQGVNVNVTLVEATSSSLREIGHVTASRGNSLNTGVSSVSIVSGEQLNERANQDLNAVSAELPGVTLNRGSAAPNSYFVVRGGYTETRVEIDGHPISTGASGTYNSAFASSLAFSSVEVTKGAGLFGPAAGESAFGTVNLRTPDFRPTNFGDVTLGVDNYAGSYASYYANVNLISSNRLSLIGAKTIFGFRGPEDRFVANHAINSALPLINYQGDFSGREYTGSELAKARYRFSETTSLSLEYLGLQGGFLPEAHSYGSFLGNKTVAACLNGTTPAFDPANCNRFSAYNAPSAQGLVGQTVPLFSYFPNSFVQNNEPIFSAELRTSFRNDTLLLRPYRALINRITNGSGEVYQPGDSGLWYQVTTPADCQATFVAPNAASKAGAKGPCFVGASMTRVAPAGAPCSVTAPCYTTTTARDNSGNLQFGIPFNQAEQDHLSGVTFSYLHPVAQNVYSFGFENTSDDTLTYTGDTSVLPPGVHYTVGGGKSGPRVPVGVPPTTIRKNDFSLTGQFALSPQFDFALGNYLTTAKLDYQIEDPVVFAQNQSNSPVVLLRRSRSIVHYDPHIGMTYRPSAGAIFRFSGGSSVTVPYAGQISGLESFNQPGPGNNNIGNFSLRNPSLRPETTVAYNLGTDIRLADGGLLSLDLFHNTIHDVFLSNLIDYVPPASFNAAPGARFTQSTTINGPIQRNYGLELSLGKRPAVGFGYFLSTSFQRAFLDQLPASLYTNQQSSLINGQQLNGPGNGSPFGSPPASVPYVNGYGELRFAGLKHSLITAGVTYAGTNNPTYGPAYTIFNSTVRLPVGSSYLLQMTIDNIFDYSGGTFLNAAVANAGSSQPLFGAPRPGDAPVFSSRSRALLPISPRVVRFQLSRHIGAQL